ncbi:DUF3662 domain-containing protein, partial [Streptomyces sp. 549]|uniref:DUF3662 domain-containing protein n=1 Tax=Streptomyces sp. 549 TaxID=3049076 RepID=UPI0032E365A4
MGTLKRWEEAVERWEDAVVARITGSDPIELLDALRQECDDRAVVCSQSRVVVPNCYDVELVEEVHDELVRQGGEVGQELTDVLARHGELKRYEWAGPLTVHVARCTEAANGRYRIRSSATPNVRAGEAGRRGGGADTRGCPPLRLAFP